MGVREKGNEQETREANNTSLKRPTHERFRIHVNIQSFVIAFRNLVEYMIWKCIFKR